VAQADLHNDDRMVQLLTPEGRRLTHPQYDVDLGDDEYRDFYRDLLLVRRLDEEATALQRQGELALWAGLRGQEAAQIGSARALRPDDMAFPSFREHGVLWCRGVDPLKLMAFFRCVTNGGWDPEEHGCQLYSIVVGAQVLHATGYAMGVALDGAQGDAGEAVLAYFGDGATSEGDVSEAFGWAGVFNAPVVFFCQNNQWAISVPLERQTRAPLHHRARGYGFPGVQVDGNDVLATYAVTRHALDEARSGQGPWLIEALTYRMAPHTTSDDPSRYRSAAEEEFWARRDPLTRLKAFLQREQLADDSFFAGLAQEADALAARIRAGCHALPDPDPRSIFDDVYTEPHEPLARQRDAFLRYQASFDEASLSGELSGQPHAVSLAAAPGRER
jgi:pyruvate dehydrogenase E1 component alpha subunit